MCFSQRSHRSDSRAVLGNGFGLGGEVGTFVDMVIFVGRIAMGLAERGNACREKGTGELFVNGS